MRSPGSTLPDAWLLLVIIPHHPKLHKPKVGKCPGLSVSATACAVSTRYAQAATVAFSRTTRLGSAIASIPMEAGDSPIKLAKLVKERVVHVHASDRIGSADLREQVAGEDCVPFAEIFRILKSANYDGWISLEVDSNKGRQGIVEGINYIREIWDNT